MPMQHPSTDRGAPVREANGPACPSPGLIARLETTRRDVRAFRRTRCLLRTALVALILAGLLAGADWLWTLGTGVRAAGLAAIALAAVALLWRGLLGPGRRFGRPDAAAAVEIGFPDLGQSVRTTLEYAEPTPATPPASPALVRALAADTDRRTSRLDFRRLVPWRSLRRWQGALAGLVAAFALLLAVNAELRTAALRLLLRPVHYTQLQVTPGDYAVTPGSDLTVRATLTGRPVTRAELYYRPHGSGADWAAVSFIPDDPPPGGGGKLIGTLETTLKECWDDLEYRVVAGPVESPVYRLTVLRPLVLKQVEAAVEPPAYTRRPAAVHKEGNFQVIAGSRVRFRIALDRAPQAAWLVFAPAGTPPLDLQVRGNELTGELPAVHKELEYEIAAEAADGMRLDAGRFRIQVQPDRKPTVRFVKPQDQIEVTPSTEVQMRLEAGDDFGLARVGIVYQVGSGPKKELFLRQDPTQPASLRAEATLPLEDLRVGFQDGVTYYAFAEDNHPERPQRAVTELQFIDIRPYKRAYQLLKTGGS
jgi:hypothetical protein